MNHGAKPMRIHADLDPGRVELFGSVADPGRLFRIPDPNFFFTRFPGLKDSGSGSASKNLIIF